MGTRATTKRPEKLITRTAPILALQTAKEIFYKVGVGGGKVIQTQRHAPTDKTSNLMKHLYVSN